METVGIIIAVYNGEKYIREQIESILDNSYKNIKIWICDDGSTDSSMMIAEEFAKNDPEKIFLSKNERNVGVILNFLQALKKSDTKYTMFCDQDDVWKKDKIKNTLNEMFRIEKEYNNKIPLTVFTDAVVTDELLKTKSESFYEASQLNTSHLELQKILIENKILGCSVMVNEAVKQKLISLPNNARMHDWWIALISASFGKISFLKEQTLLYRQHEKNVVGNQDFLAYVTGRVRTLKKQKKVLVNTQKQAEEFYKIYREQLSKENCRLVYEFAMLSKRNWFVRRYKVIKYGFLKTGFIRNIGVLLII